MGRFKRHAVVAMVAVASIGATACGSSSSSKPASPAASTPASSTPSTTTQPQLAVPPPSTPLSSPQFKAFMVTRAVKEQHATQAQATKFTACYVPKLEALGLKTAGEYAHSPDTQTNPAQTQCLAVAGIKH